MEAKSEKNHKSMLLGLATSDRETIESLFMMQLENMEQSGLDPKSYWLARIAALIAIDAAPASYIWNIRMALEMGVTAEDIMGVVVALAPTIGIAKIVAAAPELAVALDIDIMPQEKAA